MKSHDFFSSHILLSDYRMASQYSFKTETKGYRHKNHSFVRFDPSQPLPYAFMINGQGQVSGPSTVSTSDEYTPSMRGRLCPSVASTGVCSEGTECPYSHTVNEARSFNPNFKTKICEFAANGFCTKANQCRYAHSFAELGVPAGKMMSRTQSADFPFVGRNVSSVSTVDTSVDSISDPTHKVDCGSDAEMSPIASSNVNSPTTRVCYVAPTEQRTVIPKRQRRKPRVVTVPSAYHYVEQLERMRAPLNYPFIQIPIGHHMYGEGPQVISYGIPGAYYANPMMYSVASPDVIYED